MLVTGPWQLRLLICASAMLLATIVLGMLAVDVSRQRVALQVGLVQQNMSDLQDYRMKTIKWWNDVKNGRDPGLAPKAPVLANGSVQDDVVQLWKTAIRNAGAVLFLLAMAGLAALAVLWISEVQQRRPVATKAVRAVSGLVYLYAALALLIASIGIGEFFLT